MHRIRAAVCALAMVVAVVGGLVNDLLSRPAEAAPAARSLGVYKGAANPAGVAQFEQWLGTPSPWVLDYFSGRTWADIESPDWWVDG